MERALHPDLAKRIVRVSPDNKFNRLDQNERIEPCALHQTWRREINAERKTIKRLKDVTILDGFENVASVKIVASDWIDYLHIAKFNGRWVIVNVLWKLKPKDR